MFKNEFYLQDNEGSFEIYNLGDFELEDGGVISDLKITFSTYGELNNSKNNVIVVPAWFSGTREDYESYIAKERALNPSEYFFIVINQFGTGLLSSSHNSPEPATMENSPKVRMIDYVRAQHQFISKKLGIGEIALTVGKFKRVLQTV